MINEDWVECNLGDLLKLKNGFAFKSNKYQKEGIPVLRIGDIQDWNVDEVNAKRVEENEEYESYVVNKGDILIAMSGATTGKFGIYNSNKKAYQNQRVGNLIPFSKNLIDKNYIYYLLYSLKRNIEKDAYGGAQPNISASKIEAMKTKLAALPIQRAIVTKIENLFSSLDSGIADLKKAQAQLKIYRQAVLKKAFEGELTKEWRAKQKDLPTAEELLEKIKIERANYYELQMEEWKKAVEVWEENGKEGKKPSMVRAQKLKKEAISEEPFDLSKSWSWMPLYHLTSIISDGPFGSNLKGVDYIDSGIRVIRLENIKSLEFDNSKKSFVSFEKYTSIKKHTVYPNEIIFSTFIADETKVVILPKVFDFAINKADCVRIKPYPSVSNKYLQYYLASRIAYSLLVNQVHGATRPRVNTTQLKGLNIPGCSSKEQHQIVKEIESRLSVCDQVEATITESLQKSEALRQSILKKAFEGKLLSVEEIAACKRAKDYEAAGVLLERIKAEKK